jgi:O-antigen ligase
MAVTDRVGPQLSFSERSLAGRAGIAAAACVAAVAIGLLAGRSPSEAVALAAVLAFIPIAISRYTLAVGIFIVSTFLGISGTAQKGIGLLVVLVALGFLMSERSDAAVSVNFFSHHKRLTILVLAYLTWCVVGMIWATNTGDVLYSLERYVPNFLVFFAVYSAARDRRDMLVLAAFFVLGSAVAAGDAVLSPPSASAYAGVSRSGGTFGDPNYLAAVLVVGFAISIALARARSLKPFGQATAAAAGLLCLLGILFSVSRGGLIALGIALAAGVILAGRWRARLAFAALVVVLAGTGYFLIVAPAATRDRLTSSAGGGSGRTTIWKVGWREVQANPIKGVGAGNFSDAGAKYVIEPGQINHEAASYTAYFIDTPTVAHNTYLEVLAEEGIPGMILFLAIIVGSLECARRAALRFRETGDEEMELLSYGVVCGALGFLAASFFLSEEYSKQLYLLMAMGPALLKVAAAGPWVGANPLGRGRVRGPASRTISDPA